MKFATTVTNLVVTIKTVGKPDIDGGDKDNLRALINFADFLNEESGTVNAYFDSRDSICQ